MLSSTVTSINLKKLNLNGPVKLLKEIMFKAVKDGDKIIKGQIACDLTSNAPDYFELLFNNIGNLIEKREFNSGEIFLGKKTYCFNSIGQLIQHNYFDSENVLYGMSKFKYEHDEKGNIIKKTYYDTDGSFNKWLSWERTINYDDKNMIESYNKNGDTTFLKRDIYGNIVEKNSGDSKNNAHILKFDVRGNLIEEDYIRDNQSYEKNLYIYNYDNFLIEHLEFINNRNLRKWKYEDFKIDRFNNWIRNHVYFNSDLTFIKERRIEYY